MWEFINNHYIITFVVMLFLIEAVRDVLTSFADRNKPRCKICDDENDYGEEE